MMSGCYFWFWLLAGGTKVMWPVKTVRFGEGFGRDSKAVSPVTPSESFLPCFTRQNWQFERRENDSDWKAFARVCVSFQVVCALIPGDGFDMVWPCLMHQMHMKKTEQSSNNCRPGKAKRRIIGGVVRAPSEAIPVATLECGRERCICLKRSREENYKTNKSNKGWQELTRVLSFDCTAAKRFTSKMDPMPPVAPSPESKLAWFMAGCSKHRRLIWSKSTAVWNHNKRLALLPMVCVKRTPFSCIWTVLHTVISVLCFKQICLRGEM